MQTLNSLMRLWNTSYRHAQHWQMNSTWRDMIECVLNYTLTLHFDVFEGIGANLDNERWYDHVPKSIETTREGR